MKTYPVLRHTKSNQEKCLLPAPPCYLHSVAVSVDEGVRDVQLCGGQDGGGGGELVVHHLGQPGIMTVGGSFGKKGKVE